MSPEEDSSPETQELLDELRLALTAGVGPRIRQALLDRFGSPAAVFSASSNELRQTPGVGPVLSNAIAAARDEVDAAGELSYCRKNNVAILRRSAAVYPRLLQEIDDPPPVMFMRGALEECDNLAIAVVGSRHCTSYGLSQAERLAGSFARTGFTVVSGLARGIDSAAHRGALKAGGRTIAVLGGGVMNVYPPEHKDLAGEVAAAGAVISEAPPRRAPMTGSFPQRNRIITGMSLAVVVVEAGLRSGALISARHAMEQNREVFAVPGRIDSRASQGCHRLIRDGAALLESIDDLLEQLGPLVEATTSATGQQIRNPAELQLNEQEQNVLAAIEDSPTSIEQIVAACGLPVHRVLATISVLEMRRLIRRLSGQNVVRS